MRRILVVLAVTGGLLVVIPSSPGHAAEEPEPAVDVVELAGDLQQKMAAVPGFGWLRLADGASRIEVSVAGSDGAALRAAVGPAASDARVSYRPVARSYADLLAVRDRIRADRAVLEKAGITLAGYGPDQETNTIVIGVEHLTAVATALLQRRYGKDLVTVRPGRRMELAGARENDSAPWYGGITLQFTGDTLPWTCTAGPPIIGSNGSHYLLTASHCADNHAGPYVDNGAGAARERVGQVTYAEPITSTYDIALVKVNASVGSRLYRTRTRQEFSYGAHQYVAAGSVVGAPICTSGARLGERCASAVRQVNQDRYTFDGRLLINMVWATAHDPNFPIMGAGNSGGPVYSVQTGGELKVQGVMVALGREGAVEPLLPCPHPGDQRIDCTAHVFYHDIVSVLVHLGARLRT